MKQTGKIWTDAEGQTVPEKYIPAHVKMAEKAGQRIAEKALDLESKLASLKTEFVCLCQEVLEATPNAGQKRFSFYTFDRGFRIEYDTKDHYIRVYRATKANPSSTDYELIQLDIHTDKAIEVFTGKPNDISADESGCATGTEQYHQ